MSGSALVIDAVVREGRDEHGPYYDVHVTDEHYIVQRRRAARRWGSGTLLKIRIEPEDEAYTYADIKHYWGHVVQPFCDTTGYHKAEAHVLLKAECMPEGKTSITDLDRAEFRSYIEAAEQKAREWAPDAFALMDARSA